MPTQNVQSLPIDHLQPNPRQPREKILKEDMEDLIASVKAHGILEPLVVAHTPAGYQIIAGERRWRAARAAGLAEVPVVVKEASPRGMLEMAIVENVQRTDLSPLERASGFQQLMREFTLNVTQLAERTGKSIPYISNTMRLLKLPDAIRDGLAGGLITEGHARAIAQIDDNHEMIALYKKILRENLSVRAVEDLARRAREKTSSPTSDLVQKIVRSDYLDHVKAALQQVFPPKTMIRLTSSTRATKVTITFKGSPKETEGELAKLLKITKKAA